MPWVAAQCLEREAVVAAPHESPRSVVNHQRANASKNELRVFTYFANRGSSLLFFLRLNGLNVAIALHEKREVFFSSDTTSVQKTVDADV